MPGAEFKDQRSKFTDRRSSFGGFMGKDVGKRIKRTEDPRLIKGLAHYVDDIRLPDTLHVVFVRSIYAHARIAGVDVSESVQAPGVVAIYTGKDLADKI